MLKKIKKIVTLMLAGVMVLAMAAPAMAAETSSNDKGSITINGLDEGVTASAYKIAEATYDNGGNFLGYTMVSSCSDCTFQINSDGSYTESNLTEANLAELWGKVSSSDASGSETAGSNGTAVISNLGVGSYLIVITGSESVSYGMMIGSVSYAVDEETGEWKVDNGSFSVEDSTLWAKATTPTIEKTGHHTGGSDTHGESANAGDEITFDITVNNIPSYQGSYPEFEVDDVLTGLTISDAELNSLTVKANGTTLTKGTDYTVTKVSDTEFIVNFVVEGKYTLNAYAGGSLVIEYKATVDGTQTSDAQDHDNDATLTYATTSYVNHNDEDNPNEGTTEDKDYEYTFKLDALKTDGTGALADATFGLFTDSTCETAYEQNGAAVTATTGDDGIISFTGLAEGTYYMKETEAPSGYLLNQAVYTITISANYNTDGSINSWSIVITDEKGEQVASATSSADTSLTIINTKTGLLPNMGGRGTLILTLIGCAVVACAAVGVVTSRRRKAA